MSRYQKFLRINAWLKKFADEHPVQIWFLAGGFTLAILAAAMTLKWLIEMIR